MWTWLSAYVPSSCEVSRLDAVLRAEWALVGLACLFAYHAIGASWLLFAVLVLAPDLSMIGYAAGRRPGALCYNAAHVLVGPLLVVAYGWAASVEIASATGIIWLFHIAADRALGYGLKLSTGFRDTHLGRIGHD